MNDEILNVIDESDLSVTSAIVEMCSKALMLESYGISVDENSFFQEGSTPERKTVLEKVIMFIPDMIRKLVDFIKKKLRKLFGKKPQEMTEAIVETLTGAKHDDAKKKKVIAAFAAVGLAAVATATGFNIYDKRNKQVLSLEVADNTSECAIKVEYDLPYMIEGLQSSVKIVDELNKLYMTSDRSAYQKKYKSLVKDLTDATHSMKLAVSKTIEDKKYTIQSLLKELKTLETITDELSYFEMLNHGHKPFTNTESKYEQSTTELNQAISEWIKEFNKFTSDISVFLGYINASIELLCRDMYDNGLGTTVPFGYLKGLVTYCSYKSSARGFQMSTILDPWQHSEENIKPSAAANKSFGKTFDMISKIFSYPCNFAWGYYGDNWFVVTKDGYKHYDVIDTFGDKHGDTYENFAFIFGSPEQFTKTAHFFLNTSRDVIERITTDMMTPTQADDDNPSGILINKEILGKLMNFTQKGASGLPEDLMPKESIIYVDQRNISQTNRDALIDSIRRGGFSNATTSPMKGRKDIYKISLNGDSSK